MAQNFSHLKIQGFVNNYKSMELDFAKLAQSSEEFKKLAKVEDMSAALKDCVNEYAKQELQGVWLKVSLDTFGRVPCNWPMWQLAEIG